MSRSSFYTVSFFLRGRYFKIQIVNVWKRERNKQILPHTHHVGLHKENKKKGKSNENCNSVCKNLKYQKLCQVYWTFCSSCHGCLFVIYILKVKCFDFHLSSWFLFLYYGKQWSAMPIAYKMSLYRPHIIMSGDSHLSRNRRHIAFGY